MTGTPDIVFTEAQLAAAASIAEKTIISSDYDSDHPLGLNKLVVLKCMLEEKVQAKGPLKALEIFAVFDAADDQMARVTFPSSTPAEDTTARNTRELDVAKTQLLTALDLTQRYVQYRKTQSTATKTLPLP